MTNPSLKGKLLLFPVLVTLSAVLPSSAAIRLAGPFTDGAVLQRERTVPVWGWAEPGRRIEVSFGEATVSTDVGPDGKWRADLPAMAASAEGRDLTVVESEPGFLFDSETDRQVVKDVLVGEVWFVSGQSNAEMPLCGGPHFSDRNGRAVAQKTRLPLVRFCRQSTYKVSEKPRELPRKPVKWLPFTPENLSSNTSFSAMGVYYGLELYNALRIPIGLVGCVWGGTCIDPWTPREGLETRPELKDILDWPTSMTWDGKKPKSLWAHNRVKDQPSVIWNDMVSPWCPYAIRGFIWYQGESNSRQPERYASQMHALYNGWAKKFENLDLKLYFVQLAPWGFEGIATIQEAQEKFAREQPNAGMAVINDIGNLCDVHPNEKGTVGLRLALHALKRDYGFADIQDNSPTLKDWKVEGNAFVLSFNDAKRLYFYNRDFTIETPFEIAGTNGVFRPAKIVNLKVGKGRPRGTIDGTVLKVAAEDVEQPVRLRYLHSRPWTGMVYNEADLPLGAFHIGACCGERD